MARPPWNKDCTIECERRVKCAVCEKPKPPIGRSVPIAAANGYCNHECPGYSQPPEAGHLWPGELKRMDEEDES